MKLDVNSLRYLSKDEWRVLGSVELGQKNVSLHSALPFMRLMMYLGGSIRVAAARTGAQGADRHDCQPQVSLILV